MVDFDWKEADWSRHSRLPTAAGLSRTAAQTGRSQSGISRAVGPDSCHLHQPADLNSRESLVLGHNHLLGKLIPQLRDVGDDADHPPTHP
jgi:hypothetical protein